MIKIFDFVQIGSSPKELLASSELADSRQLKAFNRILESFLQLN